jgi:hypothetical protein
MVGYMKMVTFLPHSLIVFFVGLSVGLFSHFCTQLPIFLTRCRLLVRFFFTLSKPFRA